MISFLSGVVIGVILTVAYPNRQTLIDKFKALVARFRAKGATPAPTPVEEAPVEAPTQPAAQNPTGFSPFLNPKD